MADLLVRPTGSRRMLGDFLGFDPLRALTTNGFGFEINKTDNGYSVEVPVAGYAPDQIDVTLEDRVLTVSGHNERRNFTRSLLIPEEIDADTIDAKVENGMLTIALNVHPKAQPRKIAVNVVG
ncbi:MAG: Hsp20/alpha crystallin family protein [Candidatus Velthaea sp.]